MDTWYKSSKDLRKIITDLSKLSLLSISVLTDLAETKAKAKDCFDDIFFIFTPNIDNGFNEVVQTSTHILCFFL